MHQRILVGFAAVAVLVAIVQSAAYPADQALRCAQKKLTAQGKLMLCLKQSAARVLAGQADVSVSCRIRFAGALRLAGGCRYFDNGDGTVSDLDSGLMWEKKDLICPGVHCVYDSAPGKKWQTETLHGYLDGPGNFRDGLDSGTSLDGVVASGCFAGYCDWRAPTVEELSLIVDLTRGKCGGGTGPCIDPIFGPTQFECYQTQTLAPSGNPNRVMSWKVSFVNGELEIDDSESVYAFRAVRGGLSP